MNVSRNAYFTSEYLDQKKQRSPRSNLRLVSGRDSILRTPIPAASIAPETPETEKFDNPDALEEVRTPAELNYLTQGHSQRRRKQPYVEYYPRRQLAIVPEHEEVDDVTFYSEDFDSYYERKPKKRVQFDGYYIDQKKRYDAAEEIKPTLYTHKTFKEVFSKDEDERLNPVDVVFDDPEKVREQEQKQTFTRAVRKVQKKMGRDDYNSYDYYVQKKLEDERREQMRLMEEAENSRLLAIEAARLEKQNAKLERKRLKQAKKLARKQEKHDQEDGLFVDHNSDDSEDNYVNTDGEIVAAPPTNIKKALRMKWKNAKKTLGSNYFDNYEKEVTARQQLKLAIQDSPQEHAEAPTIEEFEKMVPATTTPKTTYAGVGPNENFHPAWNYLLSWLVYAQNQQNQQSAATLQPADSVFEDIPEDKIVEIQDDESRKKTGTSLISSALRGTPTKRKKARSKPPKLKNGALAGLKNYKGVFSNWNQPASAYFAGQRIAPGTKAVTVPEVQDHPDAEYEYPEFYEMEVTDDEGLSEELFYNPETEQLEPLENASRVPPTSASAMLVQNPRSAYIKSYAAGSLQIISNINKLIKSIKIMRIVFAPIDAIAAGVPSMQNVVILIELVIFIWILYELSLLIDALCMTVKAVCAPMIAIGRFMNRIV